jgi:hypothetical protein
MCKIGADESKRKGHEMKLHGPREAVATKRNESARILGFESSNNKYINKLSEPESRAEDEEASRASEHSQTRLKGSSG